MRCPTDRFPRLQVRVSERDGQNRLLSSRMVYLSVDRLVVVVLQASKLTRLFQTLEAYFQQILERDFPPSA